MSPSPASAPRTTYVAFLRGINVGRARQVAMADLREIAESVGYEDVRTLLRSGNVVLASGSPSADDVAAALERAIESRLRMNVGVVVRTSDELAAVVAADPLQITSDDGSRRHVVFLGEPLAAEVREW